MMMSNALCQTAVSVVADHQTVAVLTTEAGLEVTQNDAFGISETGTTDRYRSTAFNAGIY